MTTWCMKCRDLCVEFCSKFTKYDSCVKAGNSVYSLGKWMCFIKNGVMVLKC